MKRKNMTRRELLRRSAALGVIAGTNVLSAVSLVGCKAKPRLEVDAGAWREISSPVPLGSLSPRVTTLPGESAALSWLEPKEDRSAALRISIWRDARWSPPASIAAGQAFSRDRASAPGVIGLSPRTLIAYWSQRASTEQQSTNEIALYMAVSNDGGTQWTPPLLVNRAAAQPGEDNAYASAVRMDDARAQFIWLDGRDWDKQKRVQLISRVANADSHLSEVRLLDPDTCTCCSTSIVKTSHGLLAAYRGHTPENIRDISVVRREVAGGWSEPRVAHADRWHIEACPVNGPHLDANASRTALVWFTAPQDKPEVKLAFSDDGGADFTPPVRLDAGKAVGRAQVALLADNSAIAFWLESEGGTAHVMARRSGDNGALGALVELARGSNLGYLHVARAAGGILVAWAERDPTSQVHTGLLRVS